MTDHPVRKVLTAEEKHRRVESRRAFIINFIYAGIWIALIVLAFRVAALWLLPFVFAAVVAVLLQRPMTWLVRKTRISSKYISVVLVVLVILLLAGLVALFGWRLYRLALNVMNADFMKNPQALLQQAGDAMTDLLRKWSAFLPGGLLTTLTESMDKIVTQITGELGGILSSVASFTVTFVTGRLPAMLVAFIIWILASIFLTIDYQKVRHFAMLQVPERRKPLVHKVRDLCVNTLFRLLKAYLLLMCITFAELTVGLYILRIPYAPLWAAIIAVVDILPVLGTGTVLLPWAVIALLLQNFYLAIGLLLLYIIITVIRNILEPRLVSHQIGLSPLVTLFFMYLGLRSVGLFGMLLFPVIVMILKQLQDDGSIRLWKTDGEPEPHKKHLIGRVIDKVEPAVRRTAGDEGDKPDRPET